MNRRRFLAAAGALAASCGGGGTKGTIARPAPAIRADMGYGYYFGQAPQTLPALYVNEVADHCNLWWAAYNRDPVAQMAGLTAAKGRFRDVVLDLPAYPAAGADPETEIRLVLDRLAKAGLLAGVTHLYPIDEPDTRGLSDIDVGRRNDLIRKVAMDYPDIAAALLGVFFSVGSGAHPGIASYDRIGLSAYAAGNGQGALLDALEPLLAPSQGTWVIPYGDEPWSIDPAGLETYAHATPRVKAIIPFTWQTVGSGDDLHVGIREQPTLKPLYIDAGAKIIAAAKTSH